MGLLKIMLVYPIVRPIYFQKTIRLVSTQRINNARLSEVGKLEEPKILGKYETGQLFLHRIFGYRGVVLFPWLARVYDRDLPNNAELVKSEDGGRITTFKLPKDETRHKQWIQAIPKRKYSPTVNHNVCILHFNEEDFSRNNRRIDLKKSAIPSIFPFVNGQKTDEQTSYICDEVLIEYEANRKESMNKIFDLIDDNFPTPITDLSRILIEQLRVPGSKYFGIDTAEIIAEPDSQYDTDSDTSERKSIINTRKSRLDIQTDPVDDDIVMNDSSDEFGNHFDDFEMIVDNTVIEETNGDSQRLSPSIPIKLETSKVSDDEDKFGKTVASKLLLMSPLQRLMSEKIISEILLKGQLNMLKNSSKPVVVSGYVKSITNGTKSRTNFASSDDDPLFMFKTKQEDVHEQGEFESFDERQLVNVVKDEISWSDDI